MRTAGDAAKYAMLLFLPQGRHLTGRIITFYAMPALGGGGSAFIGMF